MYDKEYIHSETDVVLDIYEDYIGTKDLSEIYDIYLSTSLKPFSEDIFNKVVKMRQAR